MSSSFAGTQLAVPVEWGNMILWLCLEVFVLGMLVLWTSNVARTLVYRRITNALPVRIRHRRGPIDWLPMNSDLLPLPPFSKLLLTLIRFIFVILVAVSGIGIDPADVYVHYYRSRQSIVRNDVNFTGRAFNPQNTASIADAAVAGCEMLDDVSLVKYRAFIAGPKFSCNSGNRVESKTPILQVIWNRDAVKEIMNGTVLPVHIKVGEKSLINKEKSNNTLVNIIMSAGVPPPMYLARRRIDGMQYGTCDRDPEYLVVSNRAMEPLRDFIVGAAYVICTPGEQVLLRNTDEMVVLPDNGANQQIYLARRLANSLVSIVPDTTSKVYFGKTRRMTVIHRRFGILMIALVAFNSSMYFFTLLLRKHCAKGVHIDVFSAQSMFSLAQSNVNFDLANNRPVNRDIVIGAVRDGSGWDIAPVDSEDVLVSVRQGRVYPPVKRRTDRDSFEMSPN